MGGKCGGGKGEWKSQHGAKERNKIKKEPQSKKGQETALVAPKRHEDKPGK